MTTERAGARSDARLQEVLDEVVDGGVLGALAELRDESGTWKPTSGAAELGSLDPVDADGCFRIGSVTKTFTATVILQLVGEGRLGLDDAAETWLPDVLPGGASITVRQLLDHTSGLHNYTDDLTTDGIIQDRRRQWAPREIVALAARHEPEFRLGTSRAYNNTAYIVLAMVIEKITGCPYDEQIERRILRPIALHDTLVPVGDLLPEPHAHGYLAVDGGLIDFTNYNPSQAGAAGSMVSTAADLNRFFAALLTGGLLRRAELREMQKTIPTGTPGIDGGLGIGRYRLPNGAVVWGKDGGIYGYRTLSFHSPDASRQLTVSMTVAHDSGPASPEFLRSVANLFTP